MTQQELFEKIQKIVGKLAVPVQYQMNPNGSVANFSYEKEWKEGNTEPVEDKQTGAITDYKENYKQVKLTAAQCEKLDALAKDVKK